MRWSCSILFIQLWKETRKTAILHMFWNPQLTHESSKENIYLGNIFGSIKWNYPTNVSMFPVLSRYSQHTWVLETFSFFPKIKNILTKYIQATQEGFKGCFYLIMWNVFPWTNSDISAKLYIKHTNSMHIMHVYLIFGFPSSSNHLKLLV